MYGTARATGYGYSLWEFAIFTGGSGTGGGGGGGGGTGNCAAIDAAVDHPTTASSIQDSDPGYTARYATDGSTVTRWASAYADPQWLEVDLSASLPVCQVVLQWENAYATGFQIQVSSDNANWTSIYSTTTGTGGTQTLTVSGTGRYIRMYGTARATAYGYSLWSFSVYTVGGVVAAVPVPPSQPAPGNCPWINEPSVAVVHPGRAAHGRDDPAAEGRAAVRHGQPGLHRPDPRPAVAVHP